MHLHLIDAPFAEIIDFRVFELTILCRDIEEACAQDAGAPVKLPLDEAKAHERKRSQAERESEQGNPELERSVLDLPGKDEEGCLNCPEHIHRAHMLQSDVKEPVM